MKRPAQGLVLLVDQNAERCEKLAFALSARCEFEVQTARDPDAARTLLGHPSLMGVVCDQGVSDDMGLAFLQEVRGNVGTDRIAFVLLTRPESSSTRIKGWALDADAVLSYPIHASELQGCLNACLERRDLQAALAVEFTRRGEDADRTQDLLLTALESIAPGARRRGEQLATVSLRLARELHVPDELLDDLVRAARLHEIGRFVVVGGAGADIQGAAPPAVLAASAALLQPLPALEPAAELVAGMGANWDGSGPLTHLERGAIPLRSRILRVVADYHSWSARPAKGGHQNGRQDRAGSAVDPLDAYESLGLHSGTYYDAAVLAELGLFVSTDMGHTNASSVEPLRVEQLTVGRMLVNDLCTASGVKLLSAGAVLTSASLRLIAERHALDPIVHAVATRKVGTCQH